MMTFQQLKPFMLKRFSFVLNFFLLPEYGMSKDIISTEAISGKLEASYNEKLEKMAVTGVDFSQSNLLNPENLTPSTPSFQCSE